MAAPVRGAHGDEPGFAAVIVAGARLAAVVIGIGPGVTSPSQSRSAEIAQRDGAGLGRRRLACAKDKKTAERVL